MASSGESEAVSPISTASSLRLGPKGEVSEMHVSVVVHAISVGPTATCGVGPTAAKATMVDAVLATRSEIEAVICQSRSSASSEAVLGHADGSPAISEALEAEASTTACTRAQI